MKACLEIMERHLPHDGVQHILDLARQKPAAGACIIGAVDQLAEGQHLGKDRGGLGQRQRRVRHQVSAVGGKALVNAVAHLVRQRHHIARLAGEIHQDVGVRGRRDRMREGTRALAGARRRIDPVAGEKRLRKLGHLRVEPGKAVEHKPLRLVPGEGPVVIIGKRRVAVPPVDGLAAHPAGLQPVIAVRQVGIAGIDGADQRIDRFVIDVIVQIARGHRPRKAAPAVLDLLVLGDGVQHQRQQALVRTHDRRQRGACLAALVGIRAGQRIQDFRLGDIGSAERESQRSRGLVEQPDPGPAPARRAFGEHAFHVGGKHVRCPCPHAAKPWRPVRQSRHLEKRVHPVLRQTRQFKLDEQQCGADFGPCLADGLVMPGDVRVGGIGGEFQLRMACRLAQDFGDALIFGYDGRQFGAPGGLELALPVRGEPVRRRATGFDIRLDRGVADIGIEICQVPGGAAVRHGLLRMCRSCRAPSRAAPRIWGQGRAAASGKTESRAWDRMPRLTPCHADVRHLTLHIGVTIHNIIWLDTVWGRALRLRLAVATEGATARETLRYPYSTL